jgi:hypothetical protein
VAAKWLPEQGVMIFHQWLQGYHFFPPQIFAGIMKATDKRASTLICNPVR